MIKLLGRAQPLSQHTMADGLQPIRRLGLGGVVIGREDADARPQMLDDAHVTAARRQVRGLGLTPWSASSHTDDFHDDDRLLETLTAFGKAGPLETDVFLISGARSLAGDLDERRRTLVHTRQIGAAAVCHGVTVAPEVDPGLTVGSTEDSRLFPDIPSPNLAANLDLGHAFLTDQAPLSSLGRLGRETVHGHVEDMADDVRKPRRRRYGAMGLAALLATLADTGFRGGLALDLYEVGCKAAARATLACRRGLMA